MSKQPLKLVGTLVVLALVGAALYFHTLKTEPAFQFKIADTAEERERGLSGRAPLSDTEGMLFVFPEAGKYGFWMKDMRFAIDILWLSERGEVVGIERAVAPETYPASFHPPVPVRYVLEVRAGVAAQEGWDIGAHIPLP